MTSRGVRHEHGKHTGDRKAAMTSQKSATRSYVPSPTEAIPGWQPSLGYRGLTGTSHAPVRGPALLARRQQQGHAHPHGKLSATLVSPVLATSTDARQGPLHMAARGFHNMAASPEHVMRALPVKSLVLDRCSEKPEVTVERPPRPKSAGQARYVEMDDEEDDSEMDGEIEVIDLDAFTDSTLFSHEVLPARSPATSESQPEVRDPDVESRRSVTTRPKSRAGRRQLAPTEGFTHGLSRTDAEGGSGRHGDEDCASTDRKARRHSDDVPGSTCFGEEAPRNQRRRRGSGDSSGERPPTRVGFYDDREREDSGGDKAEHRRTRKKRDSEKSKDNRGGFADAQAPSSPVKSSSPERKNTDEEPIFQAIPRKSVIELLRESGLVDVDGVDFEVILVKKARSSVAAAKGSTATADSNDARSGTTAKADLSQKSTWPGPVGGRKSRDAEDNLKMSVKTPKSVHNKALTQEAGETTVPTSSERDQSRHKAEKVRSKKKKKEGRTKTKGRGKEGEKTKPTLRPLKRSPDHKELMERNDNQRPLDSASRAGDATEQRYLGSIQARADNILFGNRLSEAKQLGQSVNNAALFRKPILGEHFSEQRIAEGATFTQEGAFSLQTSGSAVREDDQDKAEDIDCRTYTITDKTNHHHRQKKKHIQVTTAYEGKTEEKSKTKTKAKFDNSQEEPEVRGYLSQGKLFFGKAPNEDDRHENHKRRSDSNHKPTFHQNKENVQGRHNADDPRRKNDGSDSEVHGTHGLSAKSEVLLHQQENLRPNRSMSDVVDKPGIPKIRAFQALADDSNLPVETEMVKRNEAQDLVLDNKTGIRGEDKNDPDDQSDSLKNPIKAATADRTLDEAVSPWEEEDSDDCIVLRKSQFFPPSREDTFASSDSSLKSWDEDEIPLVLRLPPDDDPPLGKKRQDGSLLTPTSVVPPLPVSGLTPSRWTVDSYEEDMAYKTPRATRKDPHPPFFTLGSLPVVLEDQTTSSSGKNPSPVEVNSPFQKNQNMLFASSLSSSDTLKARSAQSPSDPSSSEQTSKATVDSSCTALKRIAEVKTARSQSGYDMAEKPTENNSVGKFLARRRSKDTVEVTAATRALESPAQESKSSPDHIRGHNSGSSEATSAVSTLVSSRPARLAPLSPRSPASLINTMFLFGAPPTSVSGSEPIWSPLEENRSPFPTGPPVESPLSPNQAVEKNRDRSRRHVKNGDASSMDLRSGRAGSGTETGKSPEDSRRNFRRVSASDETRDTPRGKLREDDQATREAEGDPSNRKSEARPKRDLRLFIPHPAQERDSSYNAVQASCSADVSNEDGPSWATEIGPVRLSSSLDSKAVPTASQRKLKVISPRQSTETPPTRWSVSKSTAECMQGSGSEYLNRSTASMKGISGRNTESVTGSPSEEKQDKKKDSTSWSSLPSDKSGDYPGPADTEISQEGKGFSVDNVKTPEEALLAFMRKSQTTPSARSEEEAKRKSKVLLNREGTTSDNFSLSISAKTSVDSKEVRGFSYPSDSALKNLNSPPEMISTFAGSSEKEARRRHGSDDSRHLTFNPPPQMISTFSSSSAGNDTRLSASFGGTRLSSFPFMPSPPELISTFASTEPESADRRNSGTTPSSLRHRDGTSQVQSVPPFSASASSETKSAFPFSARDVTSSTSWLSSSLDSRTWTPRTSTEGPFAMQPSPREGRFRFTPSPPSSKPPSPDIKSHFAPAPPSSQRPSTKGLAASAESDLDLTSSLPSRRSRQLKPAASLESRDETRGVKASFPRKLKPLVSPDKLEAFVVAVVEGEVGRDVASLPSANSSQDFSKDS